MQGVALADLFAACGHGPVVELYVLQLLDVCLDSGEADVGVEFVFSFGESGLGGFGLLGAVQIVGTGPDCGSQRLVRAAIASAVVTTAA